MGRELTWTICMHHYFSAGGEKMGAPAPSRSRVYGHILILCWKVSYLSCPCQLACIEIFSYLVIDSSNACAKHSGHRGGS